MAEYAEPVTQGRRRTRSFMEEDGSDILIRAAVDAAREGGAAGGGAAVRGRARSRSFHHNGDDDDDNDDGSSSGSDGSGGSRRGGTGGVRLSPRTDNILRCLHEPHGQQSAVLSEAEKAEQELEREHMERRNRMEAKSSGDSDRGGTPKSTDYDHYVKILLLGDSGVGKTCLLCRFADNKFSPNLISTAGIDYKVQYLNIGAKRVKCQIWDTAGQERFHVITRAYYKNAHGIVLVYDSTDKRTLDNMTYWLDNIQKHADSSVEKVLLANKVDLPNRIPSDNGQELAEQHDAHYFETSAKTGLNVKEAFRSVAEAIIARKGGAPVSPGRAGAGGKKVKLVKLDHTSNRKKRQCTIL